MVYSFYVLGLSNINKKVKKEWKARGKMYFVVKLMFIEYEIQIQIWSRNSWLSRL